MPVSQKPSLASEAALPSREVLADAVEAIARDQDKQAFALLFRHFAPRIKGYILRLGANTAEAEEIAQDALMTVWRKAASFDRRQATVSTWMFTIARNRRIDVVRREKRPEIDPSDPMLVPDEEIAPDDALDASDRQERLAAAIRGLPIEQQNMVRDAFYLAKTHSEIAEQTKLPLGTVKSRLRLAFGRLRRALAGERMDGDAPP
jgi:RNA polymerase sigma-70 factor (ECF subfamily)